jgi:RHS repeat-associated protein
VAGAPTAVRTAKAGSTATRLSFEAADPHGTALTDITADNTSVTRRAYTPFGQDRTAGGNPSTWPGDQGFVGGTPDPTTGLTNLGAREYHPALGRFLSVEPVLNTADVQSLNGYAYADNTPVDAADPSGLCWTAVATADVWTTAMSGVTLPVTARRSAARTVWRMAPARATTTTTRLPAGAPTPRVTTGTGSGTG